MNPAYEKLMSNISFRLYSIIRNSDYAQLRSIMYNGQLHNPNAFTEADAQELLNVFMQNLGTQMTENNIKDYLMRLAKIGEPPSMSNANNRTLSSQSLPQFVSQSPNPITTASIKTAPIQASNVVRRSVTFIDNNGQKTVVNQIESSPVSTSDERVRKVFRMLDAGMTGQVSTDDAYLGLINLVQDYPNIAPVPNYSRVKQMIAILYPNATAISFEEFVRLINVLKGTE